MRLICGILSFEEDIPAETLLPRMCQAMQSQSRPATITQWANNRAALAVMDFAPQPGKAPPAIPSNASHAFAADIRLDNQTELEATLNLRNLSDAALALAAFKHWGDDAPTHLLGDFALAWFNREQHTLTLARDIFGIRPIAYHHQPGRHVVFASLPRGLFPSGLVPREIDPLAIARQVQFRFDAEETLFRNVRMVPPAHTITFSRHGERSTRYWQANLQPNHHNTPESAAEELRGLMDTAIRCRLPASGPAAAHLSGGIDSSTLCAFASQALQAQHPPRALHGFSFWADERPELNLEYERPYVEAVLAQHPSIHFHPVPAAPGDLWLRARSHPDRILSLSAEYPENAVCQQAAELGANCILSGWGGDEGVTFNGRGVLAQALLTLRWTYLADEMKALHTTRAWSKKQVFLGEILPYIVPGTIRRLKDRIGRRQPGFDEICRTLLKPSIANAIDHDSHAISQVPSARHNQRALLRSGHLSYRATTWATLGASYGLGFTFPMLDRRLVDFALSLPAQWHLRGGFKRRPIRDASIGILPDTVRLRHNKIMPYPHFMADMPAQRNAILTRVRELASLTAVQQLFQTEKLLALAEAIPTPEQARNAPHTVNAQHLIALLNVIPCCNFLNTNA